MRNCEKTAFFAACIFAGLMIAGSGCGQKAWNPFAQKTEQAANTSTDQDTATQGSQVYVYVVNAPGKDGLPAPGETACGGEASADGSACGASAATVSNEAGGNGVQLAKAGYQQTGLTINITTGGTAPSVTGSSTGSASQAPTGSNSQTPTQHIDPRISASVPIAVAMPGGMNDQQATAATEGSNANPSKTSENQVTYTQIKALADKVEQLKSLLDALPKTTTQPASPSPQPSPVEGEGEGPVDDGAGG